MIQLMFHFHPYLKTMVHKMPRKDWENDASHMALIVSSLLLEKKRSVRSSLWIEWFAPLIRAYPLQASYDTLHAPDNYIRYVAASDLNLKDETQCLWSRQIQVTKSSWPLGDSSICPFLYSYQMISCDLPQKLMAKCWDNEVQTTLHCFTKAMSTRCNKNKKILVSTSPREMFESLGLNLAIKCSFLNIHIEKSTLPIRGHLQS